jgi:cell division protein FtsI (penicillin-binding protein 3)
MRLNEPLGIEIAGEPNPKMDIAPGDLETIPYGYVVKMTPLQILALYNAVANNGTLVRPRFVKAIRKAGSLNEYTSPEVLKEAICSEQTLKKVRAMLEGVVQRGTATNIRKCDYEIAGKTGTVRIFEGGKYIDKYVASFVGYFPAEKPRYSCIVVVSRPMGNEYYGSRIAAPVFKEIADKVYAARLDIHASRQEEIRKHAPPLSHTGKQQDLTTVYKVLNFRVVSSNPSGEYAASGRNAETIHLMPRRYAEDVIPDVRGMGAKNAVYLLEKLGLKVSLSGKGTVTKQSLQAGQKITPGNEIRLELSML